MAWPRWRHTLNEAKRLAVKAIDEYNCSTGHYGDFIGTMVRAWLYLLQAEFQRDKIDYRYKDHDGSPTLIDGEPKVSDVLRSAKERFPATNDPVRINLELFIPLRNKVEHRCEHVLKAAAGGRAHALVINFEQELVAKFGVGHSLADRLRFPLFVESITAPERNDTAKAARSLRAAHRLRTPRIPRTGTDSEGGSFSCRPSVATEDVRPSGPHLCSAKANQPRHHGPAVDTQLGKRESSGSG